MKNQTVLVTGGAGYIGSHSVLHLLQEDYRVVVIDNCVNFECYDAAQTPTTTARDTNGNNVQTKDTLPESLRRVEQLTGKKLDRFYRLDLAKEDQNNGRLDELFHRHQIHVVIHFASLKSVSESINLPLEYYTNNLVGTINLLNVMKRNGCRNLIFSSSATVYGLPQYLPVDEKHQVGLNILNPYGQTKCMIEQILKDLTKPAPVSDNQQFWRIIALRYFNPVGAHPSGYIGEHSQDVPNNLMPYIAQVAFKKREKLYIFGNDFDTIDGTGVRDYIHIMDLANGHIHALRYLLADANQNSSSSFLQVFNLGTGRGYSVLETIETFEKINNVAIPYEIIGRREGDAGEVYADAKLACRVLNWAPEYNLSHMCRDAYKWQCLYPDGYKSPPGREHIEEYIAR